MKYSALSLAVAAISFGTVATESDIETITIEHKQAFRGDVPTRDLPQSITTIGENLVTNNAITTFQDALDFSASISRKNNSGGLWDSYSMRGLSGNENMPSGYLINGFSGGRGFSGPRDMSNVEYIEVLKGPGSALYGRSEPGGTINIITKKPQFVTQGQIKAELGSEDFKRVQGDYTTGLSDDLAVRLNGAWQDSDSFRDYVSHNKIVFTPSLYYRLNDKTSLTYEFEYVDQSQLFDRGIVVLNDDIETVPASRYLGNPHDDPTQVYSRAHQLNLNYDFDNEWSLLSGVNYRQSTLNGFSSDAELSPSRQSLYEDGETLTRQHRHRDYYSDDLSVRFELSGNVDIAGMTHHILMGVDGYDYELRTGLSRYRGGNGTYTLNIFKPDYTGDIPDVGLLYENNEQQDAYGIYFQDQVDVTSKLKVLLGARYDQIKQDILETVSGVQSNSDENRLSPRLGVVYQFTNQINVYASYSEGFLPLSGTDFQGNPFGFEESDSFEFGAKFDFDNVKGTLAIFDANKDNILVADPINVGFSAPLGEANSRGVEVDVTGYLGESTEYSLSYAYMDVKTSNDTVNADWGVALPKGSPLVNVPKNNLSVALNQQLRLLGEVVSVGGHYQYVSSRLGDAADLSFRLPSYQLVGLFAQWQVNDKTQLSANIDNLFDESYIASSYNELWAYPGAPTQFKLGLTYDF